jgi:hypothetical protein
MNTSTGQSAVLEGSGEAQSRTLTHDYAEIARWGRMLGRLDARSHVGRRNDSTPTDNGAHFRASPVWETLDAAGRNTFDFAYRLGWVHWVATYTATPRHAPG